MFFVSLIAFFTMFCKPGNPPVSSLPGIEKAAREFYSKYEQRPADSLYAELAKTKAGWIVVVRKFTPNGLIKIKEHLFCKRGTDHFNDLPLKRKEDAGDFALSQYISYMDSMNFSVHNYYGYEGWYKDVIAELSPKKKSIEDLYSLGRAYGTYANSLFSDQFGFAIADEIWRLPYNVNSLSPKQIEKFTGLQGKAEACFKEIEKRDPNYDAFVGPIGIKYANEVMSGYYILLTNADDYARNIKLPQSLYPDEVLEKARRVMAQCSQDAILVAYGDIDFYPVLYLQHTEGLRKDIYVVSQGLLNLDRFIYRATQPVFDAQGIKLSVDTNIYRQTVNEGLHIQDSSHVLSMSELVGVLKSSIPHSSSIIRAIGVNLDTTQRVDVEKGTGSGKILFFNNARYLYRNNWILLNILQNIGGRKIYFTRDFDDELNGLNNLIEKKGDLWVYKN